MRVKRMPSPDETEFLSACSLSVKIQIIIVYQGALSVSSHQAAGFCGVSPDSPHADGVSVGVKNPHDVVLFKISLYPLYPDRQDTGRLVAGNDGCGLSVQVQFALGESFAVGYPLFYA